MIRRVALSFTCVRQSDTRLLAVQWCGVVLPFVFIRRHKASFIRRQTFERVGLVLRESVTFYNTQCLPNKPNKPVVNIGSERCGLD